MSQRFTVSKSDGDRRPSDIQGEVNQLFEGDEPPTSSGGGGGAEGEDPAEVVVLKAGRPSEPVRVRWAVRCPPALGGLWSRESQVCERVYAPSSRLMVSLRKRARDTINRDEGAYTLSHTWDSLLQRPPRAGGQRTAQRTLTGSLGRPAVK